MDIDSYKIATFDTFHPKICCATCKHGISNIGVACIYGSVKCLGICNNIHDKFEYNYWSPIKPILPEELFEV